MLVFTSDMSVISWGASTPQMRTMEWTAARCLTSATTPEEPRVKFPHFRVGVFFFQQSLTPFVSVLFSSDSDSLGSKQASEKESVDFKPPEYLLPGCKDLPLSPLQPIRDDRKVREHFVLTDVSENKILNKTVTLGRFRNGGGDTGPACQYDWDKKPQKKVHKLRQMQKKFIETANVSVPDYHHYLLNHFSKFFLSTNTLKSHLLIPRVDSDSQHLDGLAHCINDHQQPLQCLRVLTLSSWNPPPGNRKMHGDLMYLNVLTLEDKELNITSSTRGFYLNQWVIHRL